ncbi:MAG: PAS domain S-box protein, partial [Gemmatimonadetes bacterium]|nr:PAS domain S-box protein [Gemmatimonadota bacterium]
MIATPGAIVLLFTIVMALQHRQTTAWRGQVERSFRIAMGLERLLSRLTDAETAERGFILSGDEAYTEPYRGARADAAAEISRLRELVRHPVQRARVDSLAPLVDRRLDINERHIRVRRSEGRAAAEALVRTGQGKATMDSIRGQIARMQRTAAVLLQQREANEQRSVRRTRQLLLLGLVLSACVAVLTHLLLRRYTAAELRSARELRRQNELLQDQAVELEMQGEQLLEQAAELEENAAAIEVSERRFRSLIENSSDVITVIDAHGRVVYESPSVERTFGFDPHAVIGRDGFENVHPEDRPVMQQTFAALLQSPGRTFSTRVRCADPAGGWRVLESAATNLLHDASVRGIVVNTRDVSERERAQAEVQAQREYLRAVIDASPSLIFAKDADGRFTLANAATARLYGTVPDALLGRREVEVAANPQEAARFADDDREVLETGREKLIPEERITDGSTGEVRWLRALKVPLTPPDGTEPQVLGVAIDITDRKQAEEALMRAQEELRQVQKMEAVGRLAGGVAHDFNNILTAVRGFAQVLLMDVPEGDPMREDLLEIDRAGERGAALARQLLAFSRRQVLRPQELDLNEVVRGTQRMLSRLIGEDVELVLDL